MKINLACIPCAIGSLVNLCQQGLIPIEKQENAMRRLLGHLATMDYQQSPPQLGKKMHEIIRQVLANPDPYLAIKTEFNNKMLAQYPEFKKMIEHSPDAFDTALRLAIAGNIIDFGPNHRFHIMETIERVLQSEFAINASAALQQDIQQAQSILYLGDNAGEIVMDRLFLETIRHPNVYFAVRGAPILNDALLEDAQKVGIDQLATVISNGDNAPGTILENTSREFQTLFNSVDLIISKGQGNYESLVQVPQNIYFLLMVKCSEIASLIGVPKGSFVVIKNR